MIVRTAAEGAKEEDLKSDVEALNRSWEKIQQKSKSSRAPSLLHTEPDLALRIARDVFNSDFKSLVVSGDKTFDTLKGYVDDNAPGLSERVTAWTESEDVFAANRIDEQLAKALDRKVYLPSGGSLVIDRTEAMTVVDVNTGRFTGQGGNLEETVTKNNLEAAEEVVRQLRLRDVGGIIVIDFIDMVLENNRDLVVRRLVECLGRDRTKHQVAEVTSLGLVQMTRKRIGQGLMETFSEPCECCNGRGEKVHMELSETRQNGRGRAATPPGAHDPAELLAKKAKPAAGTSAVDSNEDVDSAGTAAETETTSAQEPEAQTTGADAGEASDGEPDPSDAEGDDLVLEVDRLGDLQDSDLVDGDVEQDESDSSEDEDEDEDDDEDEDEDEDDTDEASDEDDDESDEDEDEDESEVDGENGNRV